MAGRALNRDLAMFLSTSMWLLMFADDIVLMATSMSKLQALFAHVVTFCADEELVIS